MGIDKAHLVTITLSNAVLIRFDTWMSAVRMAAVVFRLPNQDSVFNFLLPVASSVIS
ncbi:60S ribosomal protein l9-1 [Phtheirospermum japonicum]|uniref:60S ribosomal protein l9-1 n=1 Tax=Phtheirospermum japonicum TaxID=374723 RepID=A0A830BM53_9LAMI|nr:60S ribosomal protein l9-1 [Phtheirospermum japonicum]